MPRQGAPRGRTKRVPREPCPLASSSGERRGELCPLPSASRESRRGHIAISLPALEREESDQRALLSAFLFQREMESACPLPFFLEGLPVPERRRAWPSSDSGEGRALPSAFLFQREEERTPCHLPSHPWKEERARREPCPSHDLSWEFSKCHKCQRCTRGPTVNRQKCGAEGGLTCVAVDAVLSGPVTEVQVCHAMCKPCSLLVVRRSESTTSVTHVANVRIHKEA